MLCYVWLNKLLYHRWVSKFLRTDYLYGFVFLRCSKVHKGCFKKVTWTIHHPLSGLSLAQKRSRLKTHWTMRNMDLVFHHIFCSPATHRPLSNNRQPSLVAMAARAGLPFYCSSYWFRVVNQHEIDDSNKEENVSSGNIIHILYLEENVSSGNIIHILYLEENVSSGNIIHILYLERLAARDLRSFAILRRAESKFLVDVSSWPFAKCRQISSTSRRKPEITLSFFTAK